MVTRSRRDEIVKFEVNKEMSKILPFVPMPYLKQHNDAFWCFCSLKFQKKFI